MAHRLAAMADDPFAILGIDKRFAIDEENLRRRYLSASTQMHPDRFPDPVEQADAVESMSRLTDAYRVLCDPESRARALLALSGAEEEGDKDKLPPALLMEVMEVREEMEAAIEASNQAELDRLRQWADSQRAEHLQQLATLLDKPLDAIIATKAWLELNALRYIQRMLEQMPD